MSLTIFAVVTTVDVRTMRSTSTATDSEHEDLAMLAGRLRHARMLSGLSARELNELALKRTGTHVSLIESGVRESPQADTLEKLARVLGITLDWLIAGTGPLPSKRAVLAAVERARAADS